MAVYDFLCLDCSRGFELDSRRPLDGTEVRCLHCGSAHVRQTFESYLRNGVAAWSPARLDELRCNHFG